MRSSIRLTQSGRVGIPQTRAKATNATYCRDEIDVRSGSQGDFPHLCHALVRSPAENLLRRRRQRRLEALIDDFSQLLGVRDGALGNDLAVALDVKPAIDQFVAPV